jgi:hypothetical protein
MSDKGRLMEHLQNQRGGPDNVCGLQFAVQLSVMSFSNHCHCCSHRAVRMTFPSSWQHEVLWVPYSLWPRHVSASPALVNPHIFVFRLREDASRPTRNKMEIYNEDIATVSTGEEKKQNLEGAIVTVFITVKSLCVMWYKLQSS